MLSIYHASELTPEKRQQLLQRESAEDRQAIAIVEEILDRVRSEGASAVVDYTRRFDGVEIDSLLVAEDEFDRAEASLDPALKDAFRQAAENIEAFHRLQFESLQSREIEVCGTTLGFRYAPVRSAAAYVPGGKAAYPSSVLMGLIPARIAGVAEMVLVTPPMRDGRVNPVVLFCSALIGCRRVLRVGGAQGVAAAAYGLVGSPAEVIVGPGNRFVTAAKTILTGRGVIRMDLPAGPSEVIVIADNSATPAFIAADLLSQAEHGEDSPAILLTDNAELARAVQAEVERGIAERPDRAEMKRISIDNHSYAIIFDDLAEAIAFSNDYAPEHLEICTVDPRRDLESITAAGSVFLGHYAPVALGDYFSGTNHVLPTGGSGHFYSGLGVDAYLKRISYQFPTRQSLARAREPIVLMSRAEGLEHEHGHSVEVRFEGS